mmetsp:Transcript_25594/g.66949  ORF Transcript_25594/g.66949 Transcript_25594/m.66949 type:complete len:203 (+) Transcript_25594:286-894(+)
MCIVHLEEVSHGLDATFDETVHLLRGTTKSCISYDPHCFFLGVLLQQTDNWRYQLLDLLPVTSNNIRYGHTSVTADPWVRVEQELSQRLKSAMLQNGLGLVVISCHHVANYTQCGSLHGQRRKVKQLNECAADPYLDHSSDAIVRPVAQVRQGPQRTSFDLVIFEGQEGRQCSERGRDPPERGRRLATAQVGQGPHRTAHDQ